ncbi:hypothetical protein, partial [Salmonella enterica]|uniref:hypothetical protein n=1 Tax=Salmonella enterica TaxID=28901 RepID=UPI003CF8732A
TLSRLPRPLVLTGLAPAGPFLLSLGDRPNQAADPMVSCGPGKLCSAAAADALDLAVELGVGGVDLADAV